MTTKRSRGRPQVYETPVTATVSLRMTDAQRLELRRAAATLDRDVTGIIRDAVNLYLHDLGDRRPFPRR